MNLNSVLKYINLITENNKTVYKKDVKIIATNDNKRKDNANEEKCNIYKSFNNTSNR